MQNHLKKYLLISILLFNYSYSQNQPEIKLFIFDGIAYLSLEEFCVLKDYRFNNYPDKAKIEFFINDNHITFSNNSSFVKINDKIYHMIKNVQLVDNNFFVPLNSFVHIYSQFNSDNFITNYNDKTILIKPASSTLYQNENLIDQQLLNIIQNEENWKISTVIIDPGHGGKDPGAIGYHNIKEKHIVLDIAKELGSFLKKEMPGLNIIYTRDNDIFLGLKNRTNLANKSQGHIFLSIHANSSSAKTARGYEIYLLQPNSVDDAIDVALRENASIVFEDNPDQYKQNQMIASLAEKTYLQESEKLAVLIQTAIKKELPKTRNRGIKQAGFHVLVGAAMPKVLIETGFLTNKSEAQLLNKSSYRSQFAYGIFKGVQSYIESYNSQNHQK
jgi:N-acetylmuramoyl-L-alanine amidase